MFDVIIAGGGPAGCSAALMLGRQRRRVLVCDDGRPRNAVAPGVHGFLSRDGIDPAELRTIARGELTAYDSVEVHPVSLPALRREDDHFVATFENGSEEAASKVLLATGLVDILPEIEGLQPLWGRSVFHCRYCDGWEARDRQIAVLSLPGGNQRSALLLVLALARLSADVVWCANEGATDEQTRQLLAARGVAVRPERVVELVGTDGRLERIAFAEGVALPRQVAFIEPPRGQHSDLAAQLGCATLDDGCVEVDVFGQTSVQGVYAAGDMAKLPTMPFPAAQVVNAAASGTAAGVGIDRDLLMQSLQAGGVT